MLSFLFPIISAHGTPYTPARNSLLYVPGITTERAGTIPLYSLGLLPFTSIIFVEAVSTTLAPSTASFSILIPSTTIYLDPIKASSSIITGDACTGSNTPPIPTPPDKCTFLPI